LKGHGGRRAEEWDLGNPALTGTLSVVNKGETVYIQIFKDALTLFASAPIRVDDKRPLEYFLECCRDTSRYFALRVEDDKSKRHTYIGIGFRDRQSAFDLRAALDDQLRRITRQHEAQSISSDEDQLKPVEKQLVDLSLKEGEKIAVKINLPPKKEKDKKKSQKKKPTQSSLSKPPTADTGITPPLTKSPVKAKSVINARTAKEKETQAQESVVEDDDWGDFQS